MLAVRNIIDVNHLQRFSLTRTLQGFFPTYKCVIDGCQSSVSMTIQERALNENNLAVNLALSEIMKKT